MNYALCAAEIKRGYDSGKYDRRQYQMLIRALNKRISKKSRKGIDKRK